MKYTSMLKEYSVRSKLEMPPICKVLRLFSQTELGSPVDFAVGAVETMLGRRVAAGHGTYFR